MSDDAGTDDERPAGETTTGGAAGQSGGQSEPRGLIESYAEVSLFRLVAGVTVLALIARLVALDARPAHWDEARIAYWAQYYAETGSLGYNEIEHGPVLQLASRWMFELFGVTDTATRIPVAVVGGLLPLSALLYREHLRNSEVVALSLFLAGNSVLLYYSRFMRSDVLVAAFMFVAAGLLVRFLDTRRYWYLYGVGVFVALGFGSKENAILYLLTWAGAAALLIDQWLHSPAAGSDGRAQFYSSRVWERIRAGMAAVYSVVAGSGRVGAYRPQILGGLRRGGHVAGATVLMIATAVFVFADRGEGVEGREISSSGGSGTSLGEALDEPATLPGFAFETLSDTREKFREWFLKSGETTFDTYIDFLDGFVGVLASNAPVLLVFAVFGFLMERYGRENPRPLVLFFSYCGAASLVGYPLGTDIAGAWAWVSTHIVVPLAVPAAVGVAWLYRSGLTLHARRDRIGTAVVLVILAVVSLQAGLIVANDVYTQPQSDENELVQFAQAHDSLDPVVSSLSTAAEDGDTPDVILYYGLQGSDYDENTALLLEPEGKRPSSIPFWDIEPTCSDWSNTQPLNWYLSSSGAAATCEREPENLTAAIEQDPPAVIITTPDDYTVPESDLAAEYDSERYYLRTVGKPVVVYTHSSV